MTRRATCSCGQLHLAIEGEPSRIAMCHCLECQRRTGAVSSNQARFRREQVTFAGKSTQWKRTAESGNTMTYHFCPTCGSTVFWENEGFPRHVTVAIGNFADPSFPAPTIAVWDATSGSHCRPIHRQSARRSRGDRFRSALGPRRTRPRSCSRATKAAMAATPTPTPLGRSSAEACSKREKGCSDACYATADGSNRNCRPEQCPRTFCQWTFQHHKHGRDGTNYFHDGAAKRQ